MLEVHRKEVDEGGKEESGAETVVQTKPVLSKRQFVKPKVLLSAANESIGQRAESGAC